MNSKALSSSNIYDELRSDCGMSETLGAKTHAVKEEKKISPVAHEVMEPVKKTAIKNESTSGMDESPDLKSLGFCHNKKWLVGCANNSKSFSYKHDKTCKSATPSVIGEGEIPHPKPGLEAKQIAWANYAEGCKKGDLYLSDHTLDGKVRKHVTEMKESPDKA